MSAWAVPSAVLPAQLVFLFRRQLSELEPQSSTPNLPLRILDPQWPQADNFDVDLFRAKRGHAELFAANGADLAQGKNRRVLHGPHQ